MFRALFATCLFSCLALSVPLCRAEIMVGGMGAPEGSTHPLSQFTSLAQGTMTPYRQIAGPGIQIREPLFGTYEPNQQLIYISDFRGQAVRVFPAFASGDVAPIRVINPPRLGQTRANAPDPATGKPDPDEAVIGQWPVKAWWKKAYKHVRPTRWIDENWR